MEVKEGRGKEGSWGLAPRRHSVPAVKIPHVVIAHEGLVSLLRKFMI